MKSIVPVLIALLPVFIFLATLIVLDSYKLVKRVSVLYAILYGCATAGASFLLNTLVIQKSGLDFALYARYIAPIIEEILKTTYLVYLIKTKKVGFMVDATIYGFAVGAGFSFVENLYYLTSLPEASLFLWVIRGFGTAVMHRGPT